MKLHILGTGSAGNCYLLEAHDSTLILDLGIPFKKIKQALNFNLTRVAGAFVTHEHGDHSKGLRDAMASGIDCYASAGTFSAMGITSHKSNIIEDGGKYIIGNWVIVPFASIHDVDEPLNFLVYHPECGKMIYITDSTYCPVTVPGLNNILIEANHDWDILRRKAFNGDIAPFLKDRVIKSHMNLDTTITTLRKFRGDDENRHIQGHGLDHVNNIVLIHLSDSNSDANVFREKVRHCVPNAVVSIADAGLVIENFNINQF